MALPESIADGVRRLRTSRSERFLNVWIDKAQTIGFRNVPEKWNFHIGGYQVCAKWLKDRQAKGGKNPRPGQLTADDIAHYRSSSPLARPFD